MRKLENEDTKVSSLPQEESNPILVNIILNVSTDLHELIKKQNWKIQPKENAFMIC